MEVKIKNNYPSNSCGKKGCWTDWLALPYGRSSLVIDSKECAYKKCSNCTSPGKCKANGKCAKNGRG